MVWYAENIFNFAPPPHSRPLTRPLTAANRNNFLAARSRPEKLTRGAPFGVELERAIAHGGLCGRGAVRCAVRRLCDAHRRLTPPLPTPERADTPFSTPSACRFSSGRLGPRVRSGVSGVWEQGGRTSPCSRHITFEVFSSKFEGIQLPVKDKVDSRGESYSAPA